MMKYLLCSFPNWKWEDLRPPTWRKRPWCTPTRCCQSSCGYKCNDRHFEIWKHENKHIRDKFGNMYIFFTHYSTELLCDFGLSWGKQEKSLSVLVSILKSGSWPFISLHFFYWLSYLKIKKELALGMGSILLMGDSEMTRLCRSLSSS